MTTTNEIFAKINSSAAANPEKATSVNALFQLEIGGKAWSLDLRQGAENFVSEGASDDAAVTISMAEETFTGMITGSVNPMQAFMMGQVKVSGDMALAMKLQNILSLAS